MLSWRPPDAVAGYRQVTGSKGCSRCRVGAAGVGEVQRGHGEGLWVGTKVFLEDHAAPQEGETGNLPSCVQ